MCVFEHSFQGHDTDINPAAIQHRHQSEPKSTLPFADPNAFPAFRHNGVPTLLKLEVCAPVGQGLLMKTDGVSGLV